MKSLLKWGMVLFLAIGVVALIGYLLVAYGVIRMNYPSKIIYPVQGIDISHHQGDIDWEAVSNDGWDFVIMKSTEGGDWEDSKFVKYYAEAEKSGMIVGVYHYYSFCTDPISQAEHFIEVAGDLSGKLPPAVDLEFDNNCNKAISVAKFQEGFKSFVSEIREEYGVYPIVYCNEEFYKKYLNSPAFSECLFWVRNVVSQPNLNGLGWTFWQYTAKGTVSGIKGPVDLNAFSGRRYEFEELIMD